MVLKRNDGTEYTLHWTHNSPSRLPGRSTTLTIHEGRCERPRVVREAARGDGKAVQAVGPCPLPNALTVRAVCKPRDRFQRSVGRKIALTRALKALSATMSAEAGKSYRTELWLAYWTILGQAAKVGTWRRKQVRRRLAAERRA